MFTCGFDRSNFSLPMTARLLVLAGACRVQVNTSTKLNFAGTKPDRSVVRVQLKKPLAQLWGDTLQAGEIELANLALIGVAQPMIFSSSRSSQVAFGENIFEVANAQLRALQRLQK